MPLPETDLFRIRRWCEARVPKHLWPKLKVEAAVTPRHVTIVEVRPHFMGDGPPTRFRIARLSFSSPKQEWSLYWRDRNLKFHRYERFAPTKNVQAILDYLASHQDPIFWG